MILMDVKMMVIKVRIIGRSSSSSSRKHVF